MGEIVCAIRNRAIGDWDMQNKGFNLADDQLRLH